MSKTHLLARLGLLILAAAGPAVTAVLLGPSGISTFGVSGMWLALIREVDKAFIEPWLAGIKPSDATHTFQKSAIHTLNANGNPGHAGMGH